MRQFCPGCQQSVLFPEEKWTPCDSCNAAHIEIKERRRKEQAIPTPKIADLRKARFVFRKLFKRAHLVLGHKPRDLEYCRDSVLVVFSWLNSLSRLSEHEDGYVFVSCPTDEFLGEDKTDMQSQE